MRDKLKFKNNLKKIRTEKKLSQGTLAEMAGVSRNAICSIEKGEYFPTAPLALSLCIVLEVKFEQLFYFEGYEPQCEEKEVIDSSSIKRLKEYLSAKGWSAKEILDLIIYLFD